MNKAQLVEEIRYLLGGEEEVTKAEAERSLNAVLDAIEAAVLNGERVVLSGFGVFEMRERSARQGRNPQTGETIEIPAKVVPAAKLTFGRDR